MALGFHDGTHAAVAAFDTRALFRGRLILSFGMTSSRLEDYALIGDRESAALVRRNGAIEWLCWPRFDSDACLAALLGRNQNGRWLISARDPDARTSWRYREDTLIVETETRVGKGAMRVVDFMPVRHDHPTLVRQVVGLSGEIGARMVLRLRFDYGSVPPWMDNQGRRAIGRVGPDLTALYSDVPLELDIHDPVAEFTVREGDTINFVLRLGDSASEPPGPVDVDGAIAETESFWRDWIGRFDKPTDWPEAVRRSLITLKALTSRRTGGIVAAPTTSLPEIPGGKANWDYRYCWLRDSTFALAALLNAGYVEEAGAWRDWILRAIAGSPENIQIMYRIDGGRTMPEWTADWLDGYGWSRPVQVGNGAARQRQIDVYGELLEVMRLAEAAGLERPPRSASVQKAIIGFLGNEWQLTGHGIWENRGEERHYVYSKVMAWVAVDRFLKSSSDVLDEDGRRRLAHLRQMIHDEVCADGFHSGLNSFVQYYGSQEVDAALLLLPSLRFLPPNDPRIKGTVSRIEKELVSDGLVYRNTQSRDQGQGAFLACSCWLADCYMAEGRADDARAAFERLLSVRSDLGLLSEEYDIRGQRLSGNFPQGLSHLALITTGLGLCGPVLQRGGG